MPEQSVTLTFQQLKELITEIKKPSAEEQEEIEKKKALKKRALEQRRILAAEEIKAKAERELLCNHRKEKGESSVFGQKHSDGMIHPICVRCQKEFPPYKPRAEDY